MERTFPEFLVLAPPGKLRSETQFLRFSQVISVFYNTKQLAGVAPLTRVNLMTKENLRN